MQSRWEDSDPLLVGFCAMTAFIFAGTWGGLLWIFFPDWGWKVGAILFMPCFVVLYNLGRRPDLKEDEYAKEYYE